MNTVEKRLENIRTEVVERATCCKPLSPIIIATRNLMHVQCALCGRYFTSFVASATAATIPQEEPLTVHGKTQSIKAWALEVGVTTKMIRRRLGRGESSEDAIFRPCR